ncbi:HvfC/BufC family peptide modification chaperone [Candidatus Berkiella aquae]|uniref:DNA-binding domain-containing protein n=1 Tax=Candidatus Berkiella aquae TaxID=295108 RepID=A0A0Q9YW69_9GAMM|nr:DNA-binding domain-containing protein [Candidatus Berkiella aquae]MCS5711182.1 DNA-binding domain-containing protein [Candidatus Berkiella aquae]
MKLSYLQESFQQYLMHGDESLMLPSIAKDDTFSAQRRLKVYFDAYRLRLCEILQLDFPKTYILMGDEHFSEAFIQYLNKHPSQHFSVRYFGQYFSNFLRHTAPYSQYPALAEMADFEWAIAFTIDAEDASIAKTEDFTSISPENWPDLVFNIHPAVVSQYFHFDTPLLWQVIENEEPMRAPIKQLSPVRWLFWRKGIKSYFKSCNAAQDKMFQGVLAKLPFGELCENLLSFLPENEIAAFAAQTLYQWVQDEMISSIELIREDVLSLSC